MNPVIELSEMVAKLSDNLDGALKIIEMLRERVEILEGYNMFVFLVKNHDWHFDMSDDPSIYERGQRNMDEIMHYFDRLKGPEKEMARELYNKEKPKSFRRI